MTWEVGKKYQPGEKGSFHIVFDSTEKEESEDVDIDIYLDAIDPKTGGPIFYILKYSYELVE